MPPDQQFQFSRLLTIFFQQQHEEHEGRPFLLRSGPVNIPQPPAGGGRGRGRGRPPGRARGRGAGRGVGRGRGAGGVETAADIAARVPRFVDLFRQTMEGQQLRGIEEYVWEYHLENGMK